MKDRVIFLVGVKTEYEAWTSFSFSSPSLDMDTIEVEVIEGKTLGERCWGRDDIDPEEYDQDDMDTSWTVGFHSLSDAISFREIVKEKVRDFKDEPEAISENEIIIMKAIIPEGTSFVIEGKEIYTNHIIGFTNKYWIDYE